MYLTLGCLFDGISFMVMTLPFVFPIIKGLGFGGIWFGVLMIILIEVGQLTPPVGLNLFIIQSIAEKGNNFRKRRKRFVAFFYNHDSFLWTHNSMAGNLHLDSHPAWL